jgi:hypothetical protein
MPAMWCRAFHGAPGPEAAGEPEFLPGNDGFSYAFAQCEVEDRFGTSRRRGFVGQTYHSLTVSSIEPFQTALAQPVNGQTVQCAVCSSVHFLGKQAGEA